MYLEEYLKTKSLSECIELNNLIQKNGSSFKSSIIGLMKKNYIDNKQIATYQKKCTKKVEEQFQDLVTLIKKFDKFRNSIPRPQTTKKLPKTRSDE